MGGGGGYIVIPAKAGIYPRPIDTPGTAGVLDSGLRLPKDAGMTVEGDRVMVGRGFSLRSS